MTSSFLIREFYDADGPVLATIDADTGRDALALYSLREGFADPRDPGTIEDGQDWFHHDELLDVWTMIFTNTTLVAQAVR